MIHSLAGLLDEGKLLRRRPFRDPHHSASLPALVGGEVRAKPGEISLAHNGVLFLDKLPEFQRGTLEALRQPLETGRAVVSRANHHVTYPARVQLIAAMNPFRCGHLADPSRTCGRAPKCAADYQSRISGPLFDRIDCHIEVPAVSAADLSLPPLAEDSAIVAALEVQTASYQAMSDPSPHQRRSRWRIAGKGSIPRPSRTHPSDPSRRTYEIIRSRLPPRPARRTNPRRSGRPRQRPTPPHSRSLELQAAQSRQIGVVAPRAPPPYNAPTFSRRTPCYARKSPKR